MGENTSTDSRLGRNLRGQSLAEEALARGVTVLALEPNPQFDSAVAKSESNREFTFPVGYPSFSPDPSHYENWAEGRGLAMITGDKISVIDLDLLGTDLDDELARLVETGVLVVAVVKTPRGGRHIWTLGDSSFMARSWPMGEGRVDFIANGSLAYVPGCSRPKYGGAGYEFETSPDWSLFDVPAEVRAANKDAVEAYLMGGRFDSTTAPTTPGANTAPPSQPVKPTRRTPEGLPVFGSLMEEDAFWSARDYLEHVKHQAWANINDPYAVLLATLSHVSAELDPHLVMPGGFGGTAMSMSYFGCIVGETGQGKSGAMRTAGSLYDWTAVPAGVTSGEGLITTFAHVEKKDGKPVCVIHDTRAFIQVDEGEFLTSVDERKSNTSFSILRTLWSDGGGAGINNRRWDEKLNLPMHSVQVGMVVGAQMGHLGRIFEDSAGTSERFILQLAASYIPPRDLELHPLPAGSLPFRASRLPTPGDGLVEFVYDSRIAELMKRNRYEALLGQESALSEVGHRQALVAKTACLFAAWDGRLNVSVADWELAIHFEAVSRRVRGEVREALRKQEEKRSEARSAARGRQEASVEEARSAEMVGRAAKSIVEKVRKAGDSVRASDLKKSITAGQRPFFDEALSQCIADGLITAEERVDSSGRKDSVAIQWLSVR